MRRLSGSAAPLLLLIAIAGCQHSSSPVEPATLFPAGQTAAAGSPQSAFAAAGPPLSCAGQLIGGTFADIVVPGGATCKLSLVHVTGSVKVEPGGALQLFVGQTSGNRIDGNVQAEGARWITSGWHPGNTINGSVRIVATSGVPRFDPTSDQPAPANYFCRTAVGRDVQIAGGAFDAKFNFGAHGVPLAVATCTAPNRVGGSIRAEGNAGELWVSNNLAGQHVQVSRNAAVHVFRNGVAGSLRCDSNVAIDGGNNAAASKKGQCAAF